MDSFFDTVLEQLGLEMSDYCRSGSTRRLDGLKEEKKGSRIGKWTISETGKRGLIPKLIDVGSR